jgi:hypothetical protein
MAVRRISVSFSAQAWDTESIFSGVHGVRPFGPSPRIPLPGACWLMKKFRYCLSPQPSAPSAPTSELSVVIANSLSGAIELIRSSGYLKNDRGGQWLHVLVWNSDDGEDRGFASSWL